MLIISIIITATLTIYKSNTTNSNLKETNDKLTLINQAIAVYVSENRRLPCPASIKEVKSSTNYGTEVGSPGSCSGTGVYYTGNSSADNLVYGMLPTKALAIDSDIAEDGFGSKFSYIVSKPFTESYSNNDGFEGTDTNAAGVVMIIKNSDATIINSQAVFTVISHGPNRLGAYSALGATQNSITGITGEENDNILDSEATPNYDNIFIINSDDSDYDDILLYKSRIEIAKDAGFEFMRCRDDILYSYNPCGSSYYWFSGGYYGETVNNTGDATCNDNGCSSGSQIPARTCGKYGEWEEDIANPC